MAPHSSTLAWKIPWTEEPGGPQSMGQLRIGQDSATSLSLFSFMHWRRKWQPTPVFLPGESQGRGSLVGCRLWGRTESDTTEATQQQQQQHEYEDVESYRFATAVHRIQLYEDFKRNIFSTTRRVSLWIIIIDSITIGIKRISLNWNHFTY